PEVEAAVAGLHVEDRNLVSLCWKCGQGAVGITQHQQSVGLVSQNRLLGQGNYSADRLDPGFTCSLQVEVRRTDAQLIEEDLTEFMVEALPGMYQSVIGVAVQPVDHSGQPDDLRPSADDRHHLKH